MAWIRNLRSTITLRSAFKIKYHFVSEQYCSLPRIVTMSGERSGLSLKEVVKELDKFANPNMAESWDNVGLLIEPATETPVKHILITNDLTEEVMDEALKIKANLIISYHPPIFAALKRITNKHWKERIIAKCLENRIAIYSPHTAWDAVHGGVSDWLCDAFKGFFDESSKCPLVIPPTSQISEGGQTNFGMGRIFDVHGLTLDKCIQLLKTHTGLPHLRIALAHGKTLSSQVSTIALVPGSGSSLLKGVKADLHITGEMFHHNLLETNHFGTSVILTNHSDSERGFINTFLERLSKIFNDRIHLTASRQDKDPIITV